MNDFSGKRIHTADNPSLGNYCNCIQYSPSPQFLQANHIPPNRGQTTFSTPGSDHLSPPFNLLGALHLGLSFVTPD